MEKDYYMAFEAGFKDHARGKLYRPFFGDHMKAIAYIAGWKAFSAGKQMANAYQVFVKENNLVTP